MKEKSAPKAKYHPYNRKKKGVNWNTVKSTQRFHNRSFLWTHSLEHFMYSRTYTKHNDCVLTSYTLTKCKYRFFHSLGISILGYDANVHMVAFKWISTYFPSFLFLAAASLISGAFCFHLVKEKSKYFSAHEEFQYDEACMCVKCANDEDMKQKKRTDKNYEIGNIADS